MLVQLKFHGLRYRLGLATWLELRQVSDAALNAEIYSPSLVDAALDAEENLWEIGLAFEKALSELELTLPESQDDCCWKALEYYINQIANKEVEPLTGLKGIMEVCWGCQLYEQSKDYVGDSYDIHELIGSYWGYEELFERPKEVTYNELAGEAATLALDANVIEMCRAWLREHTL
ncbi:MAG: hypothetical protein AAF298_23795 [Cyanobacteria bacterium P01_A01_bin.40]